MPKSKATYIRLATEQAQKALATGNPPFGAVIERNGEVLASAHNEVRTSGDSSLHAELNAIRAAHEQGIDLKGATLYASSEPCAMCAGAIYWSGIRKVAFAASKDALAKIRPGGLSLSCKEVLLSSGEEVSVIGPEAEEEIIPLLQSYYGKEETA